MNGLEAGQYLHNRYTQATKILVADMASSTTALWWRRADISPQPQAGAADASTGAGTASSGTRCARSKGALGMGVGAPIAGGSGNAALYTYGTVDGATGIYRSTDYGTHWHRLSGEPGGPYMGIRAIAGDPQDQRPRVPGVEW
jgi:hypothetical protein